MTPGIPYVLKKQTQLPRSRSRGRRIFCSSHQRIPPWDFHSHPPLRWTRDLRDHGYKPPPPPSTSLTTDAGVFGVMRGPCLCLEPSLSTLNRRSIRPLPEPSHWAFFSEEDGATERTTNNHIPVVCY